MGKGGSLKNGCRCMQFVGEGFSDFLSASHLTARDSLALENARNYMLEYVSLGLRMIHLLSGLGPGLSKVRSRW